MKAGHPKNLKPLRARPAQAWAQALAALPEHLQAPVASLVWWDFFGPRISAERWTELDRWVNQRPPEDERPEEVVEALVRLGYPRRTARQRIHFCPKRSAVDRCRTRQGGISIYQLA
jgi:hypothetical protein